MTIDNKKLCPNAVLIDDDLLVCDAWKFRAANRKAEILTCVSVDEFKKLLPQLDPSVPIFIDSSLGQGVKGECFAKELYDQGLRELYLATGYPASHFGELPWIKAIVSKEPPDWIFHSKI